MSGVLVIVEAEEGEPRYSKEDLLLLCAGSGVGCETVLVPWKSEGAQLLCIDGLESSLFVLDLQGDPNEATLLFLFFEPLKVVLISNGFQRE